MPPDPHTTSRDRKVEAVIIVAALGTGPATAHKRVSFPVPPQPECSAQTTFKEEEALQRQPDEALHHRPVEEAEAVPHEPEDVEDAGRATEEWPTCTP